LEPTQPPVQWYRIFPGGKGSGRGVDQPPPPRAEVKESAELYVYSPSELCGLLHGDFYIYFYN